MIPACSIISPEGNGRTGRPVAADSESVLQAELSVANVARVQHMSPDDFLDGDLQHPGNLNSILGAGSPARGYDGRDLVRGKSALVRQFIDRQTAGFEQLVDPYHRRGFHRLPESGSLPGSRNFYLSQLSANFFGSGKHLNPEESFRSFVQSVNDIAVTSRRQQFNLHRVSIREEQVVHGYRHT